MYLPRGGVNGHAGQATMVEAERAMEAVRAQVILARQFPRNVPAALAAIRETFSIKAMADRSFYSYPRGRGNVVSGTTIHLAKAVAQAWGNIDCSIDELSRTAAQSEMKAWAWDLETNQRMSTTFIVPHAMDVSDGVKELKDLRSIYENNANMANRRLRAMIESVIPAYVFDLAKQTASQTLKSGGGEPLPVRVAKAISLFQAIGIDVEQIEAERGRESGRWTDIDMAHLRVVLQTIERGEIRAEDVFPPRQMSVVDVTPVVPAPEPKPSAPVLLDEPEPKPAVWPEVTQPGQWIDEQEDAMFAGDES